MDYETAKRQLFSLINYEKTPQKGPKSLIEFLQLLSYFNYPEDKLQNTVVIRGTKGKGSTSIMLAQILSNNGYRTGLFTSPHLISIRERISVDLEYISKKDFTLQIEEIFKLIRGRRGIRTYFEILTLLAIIHFLNKNCQFSIFEAGLGGRLDTTRLLDAKIHILSEVGFDHVGILGNTIRDITYEKICGVDRGILITLNQHPKASYVIERIANQRKLRLIKEGKDFEVKKIEYYPEGTLITLNTVSFGNLQITIPLPGRFLTKSAILSCIAAEKVGVSHCNLKGLELPARFQKIHDNPIIIIDGSHNPMSLLNLKRELEFYYKDFKGKKTLVFAMMRDKSIKESLYILQDYFDSFIFTEASVKRSEKMENIKQIFSSISSKPSMVMNREEVLTHIMTESDFTVITGSFFIAGDILKSLVKRKMYPDKRLYMALD